MTITYYHVVPVRDGGWSVKRGGATRASRTFDDKIDAVRFAKLLSANHGGKSVIHRKDGTIQNAEAFGNDPNPPKDKK